MTPRFETDEQRREQAERVRTLADHLQSVLAGQTTRAELLAWLRALPVRDPLGPFRSGIVASVYDSLLQLDLPWPDGPLIRDVELQAYLLWLTDGCDTFDDDLLFMLGRDIEVFAGERGAPAVRWWNQQLGWWVSLQFATPASGRLYVAHAALERPNVVGVHKQPHDDLHAALVDVFEALAIDEADVSCLHPLADLTRLPTWALWRQDDPGNRFEMARYHSQAKALAQVQLYAARGHRQTYWVEPA